MNPCIQATSKAGFGFGCIPGVIVWARCGDGVVTVWGRCGHGVEHISVFTTTTPRQQDKISNIPYPWFENSVKKRLLAESHWTCRCEVTTVWCIHTYLVVVLGDFDECKKVMKNKNTPNRTTISDTHNWMLRGYAMRQGNESVVVNGGGTAAVCRCGKKEHRWVFWLLWQQNQFACSRETDPYMCVLLGQHTAWRNKVIWQKWASLSTNADSFAKCCVHQTDRR